MQRIYPAARPRWPGLLLATGLAISAGGCASEPNCSTGTEAKDGACVAKATVSLTCGAGTIQKDGKCMPESTATLACGAGTEEKSGKCMPVAAGATVTCGAGTEAKDGKCVATAATLACGVGTIAKDGLCIVDTVALKAKVQNVIVKQLSVEADGVRPLMVLHDVTVNTEVEVTGEAFETLLVVGVRNADSSKVCPLGFWDLKHKESAAAPGAVTPGVKSFKATYKLEKNFFVQPSCEALIGEKGLIAFVSFDPFLNTAFAARPVATLPAKDTSDAKATVKLILDSALPLTGCKAGATSPHPDTCATSLEVVKSAGTDLRMEHLSTSKAVVVLEYVGEVPPPIAATTTEINGVKVDFPATDWSKLKPEVSTAPALLVSTELLAYGLNPVSKQKFSSDDFGLTFSMRPVDSANEEWMPMTEKFEQASKAGTEPTVEFLEKVFLKSLVAETKYIKESPVFFTAKGQTAVTTGKWMNQAYFDLKICADGAFPEGGVDADAKVNNCKVTQFVLVRDKKNYVPDPNDVGALKAEPKQNAGAIALKEYGGGWPWGNPSNIQLSIQMALYREWDGDQKSMRLGGRAGAYLNGWFSITILESKSWIEARTIPSQSDSLGGSFTIFSQKLTAPGLPLGQENYDLMVGDVTFKPQKSKVATALSVPVKAALAQWGEMLKYTKEKEFTYGWDVGQVGFVGVKIGLALTVGLDLGIKKTSESTGGSSPCDATSGPYCYRKMAVGEKSFDQAKGVCAAAGGKMPSDHGNPANHAALTALANATKSTYWGSSRSQDGKKFVVEGGDNGYQPNKQAFNVYFKPGVGICGAFLAEQFLMTLWSKGLVNSLAQGNGVTFPCQMTAPVVCEFPTQPVGGEKSELFAVFEPYIDLSAYGDGGFDIWFAKGGIKAQVSLLKFSIPVEGGLTWLAGTASPAVEGSFFVRIQVVLSSLFGDIRVYGSIFWVSVEYKLYEWTGYTTSATVMSSEFQQFKH